MRKLPAAGARLVFSTDWPVSPIEVGITLKAAVAPQERPGQDDERQSLGEALHSYTAEAAFAEFTEDRKGRLAAGYLADIVIMQQDLHEMPPDELDRARPALTLCGGRITFEE